MSSIITPQSLRDSEASMAHSELLDLLSKTFVKPPQVSDDEHSSCSNPSCSCSPSLSQDDSKTTRKRSLSYETSPTTTTTFEFDNQPDIPEMPNDDNSDASSVSSDEDGIYDNQDMPDSERVQCFTEFLENIDDSMKRFNNLDNMTPQCSQCQDSKASDLFCNHCMDFFCTDCHDSCSNSSRHSHKRRVSTYNADNVFRPSLPNHYQEVDRNFEIDAVKTLCSCDTKDGSDVARLDLLWIGDDFKIFKASITFCEKCSCGLSACLRYGYVLIPVAQKRIDGLCCSLQTCNFITSLSELTLRDLAKSITDRNYDIGMNIKLSNLALVKYAYCQVLKRLDDCELELCPCCFCPRRSQLCPSLMIQDYTNLRRSNKSSDAKIPGLITSIVKDEDFFAEELKTFEAACKRGGSKSIPQTVKEAPKKKTCVDKFKLYDPPSKFVDIRKLLLHCCEHGYPYIGCISRAAGERAQYCLATTAKVKEIFNLLVTRYAFDAACQLVKVGLSALPYVPTALRESFLDQFCRELTFGPFHFTGHTTSCQVQYEVAILADVIESIFSVLKVNVASLRPMIYAFWVCEVDFRLCKISDEKLRNLGVTTVEFSCEKNPDQMEKLQKRILTVGKKLHPEVAEENILRFESFAEEVIQEYAGTSLTESRNDSLVLQYIGLRLKLKYTRVMLARAKSEVASKRKLPSLMPPTVWEYACGPSGNEEFLKHVLKSNARKLILECL